MASLINVVAVGTLITVLITCGLLIYGTGQLVQGFLDKLDKK